MRAWVGITDSAWFTFLASLGRLEEVNFWQPGGTRRFRGLDPGELFLFKLHSPRNFIVGGGVFAHATLVPLSLAWESFGPRNGAASQEQMKAQIERYRGRSGQASGDFTIGCSLITQPFFLPEHQWIPVPNDWPRSTMQGKSYALDREPGLSLYLRLRDALGRNFVESHGVVGTQDADEPSVDRYGSPTMMTPRLGQGAFRILVTDAYERRCAITGERVLTVLDAAHIRPFSADGEHRVDNGLLLRSDLHKLFDRGYLTVAPDLRIEVSRRIHEEFNNGKVYYALLGQQIRTPGLNANRPSLAQLRWHNENVYLG